jgi:2-phosphosulfolactate phosphatase
MNVQLQLTPYPLQKTEVKGKTVVVIDVLRSSTSICAALLAGARSVIPTAKPGESGELYAKLGTETTVLAGERQGVKIENFQFGNSPTEFTPETVGGKNLILCTTNGTGIFGLAGGAAMVLAGGMVNVSVVADAVAKAGRDLVIACAGREGGFSIEDTLCGGLLLDRLRRVHDCELVLNDAGSLARLLFNESADALHKAVLQGEHGSFLVSLGLADDVAICTEVDSMPILPVLRDGRLVKSPE